MQKTLLTIAILLSASNAQFYADKVDAEITEECGFLSAYIAEKSELRPVFHHAIIACNDFNKYFWTLTNNQERQKLAAKVYYEIALINENHLEDYLYFKKRIADYKCKCK